MANEQDKNPATGSEKDISKAQAQQQPEKGEQAGQFETGQQGSAEFASDQADSSPDAGQQGDTMTRQRSDIEGSSLQSERGEAESGFVGGQGQQDTSSELVDEEDEDLKRDEGGPEGK